jgi:hypothetical protein
VIHAPWQTTPEHLHADPRWLDAGYSRQVFSAGTGEQCQLIAETQAQDLDRVMRDPLRQIDTRTDRQRHRAMEAGSIHRGIIRAYAARSCLETRSVMALNTSRL